jgi:serine protease Do
MDLPVSFYRIVLTAALGAAVFLSVSAQTEADRLRAARVTPDRLSASFAEIIKTVSPAVVKIDTLTKRPEINVRGDRDPKPGEIGEMLRPDSRPVTSVGSGFIFDSSGLIVTNSHVVEDVAKIYVQLSDGNEFVATVVGVDEETDIAVLSIDAGRELPALGFADSSAARVGDWVLAFGSPFGLARTVTAGIISQVGRETPTAMSRPFQRFIQTDAAINRGNSGGPLIDMNGEVVGVNSQIATSTGDYNGIGFALPANEARRVIGRLVANGAIRRGYLGVNMESVKAEFAKVYGLSEARGAVITNISDPKSAAAVAGLRPGDVILEIDGRKVEDARDLIEQIAAQEPEKVVRLAILRENGTQLDRLTIPVTLAERPSANRVSGTNDRRRLPVGGGVIPKPLGLTVADLSPSAAAAFKITAAGVQIKSVEASSLLADLRTANGEYAVREGDIITRVNRIAVPNAAAFASVAGKLRKGDAVVFHILSPTAARTTVPKIVQFTVR